MLPAEHRLRDGDSFRRTIRGGRRGTSTALVAHLSPAAPTAGGPVEPVRVEPVRVGLVVGRQVGNAVTRNRVKRRLRHLLSSRLVELPPASTLVIRALPAAADLNSTELDAQLSRCLLRAMPRTTTGSRS